MPFKNESSLLNGGESAENAFLCRQHELQPLMTNMSVERFIHAEQMIQQALTQTPALRLKIVAIDVDGNSENHDVANSAHANEIIIQDLDDFKDNVEKTTVMPDEVFHNNVRSLNV